MLFHLDNPDLQTKLDRWASETGRPVDELLEEAMAGYFAELTDLRGTLDIRYDEIKSGKVKLIDGEEAFQRLIKNTEAQRKIRA